MDYINSFIKKYLDIVKISLFLLGCFAITYATNNYFTILAPFVIAYVITVMLRPTIVSLKEKTKMPNFLATLICLIICLLSISAIVWTACHYAINGISNLVEMLSSKTTMSMIMDFARDFDQKLEAISNVVKIDISASELTKMATEYAGKLITVLSSFSVTVAMNIPNIIISFVIGCVASVYMLFDYEKISSAVKSQMMPRTIKFVSMFNNQVLSALIKMIFSYALMSVICFIELMIGFSILKIENAVLIALIISIFDVLPVVGSGGLLVPGGVLAIIMGDSFVGIGLIVLWGVLVVVRQILEPYIVGSQVGLHPLITVASLYIGLKLMGGLGLIVAPLYVLVCKQLAEEGLFAVYEQKEKKNKQ